MDSVSLVRVQVDDDCCVKLHQFVPHVLTELQRLWACRAWEQLNTVTVMLGVSCLLLMQKVQNQTSDSLLHSDAQFALNALCTQQVVFA